MMAAYLEITLTVAPENRTEAAGVYEKYEQPFLAPFRARPARSCSSATTTCRCCTGSTPRRRQRST
jgi:hypothetical protein